MSETWSHHSRSQCHPQLLIRTCERKLHHSSFKEEMWKPVSIKRWEYIWTHLMTTRGPITHILTLLHFQEIPLISCSAHQSEWTAMSGLWVLTVLISWATNAGLTNVFWVSLLSLFKQLLGTNGCWNRENLYDCSIFSAFCYPEFSLPAYSDWLWVLHHLLFIHSVFIWLTALQISRLASFPLLSLIRTEYLLNSFSRYVYMRLVIQQTQCMLECPAVSH